MQILFAMAFLFIILFIAYNVKADFFLLVFIISVYLYILIYLFILNPFEIGLRMMIDLFSNPLNFFFLIIPFILILLTRAIYSHFRKKPKHS